MRRTRLRLGLMAVLVIAPTLLSAGPVVRRVTFTPPEESVPAELGDVEGEAVVTHCTACHSLEYITTQPRGKGAQFWKDEVTKMVNVYKAPLEAADAEAVAAVLAHKFG